MYSLFFQVSLDSRVREVINRNMVEPTPHTFDEAQLQIWTLMHRDSYPRFLNSQMYKKLLQQLSWKSELHVKCTHRINYCFFNKLFNFFEDCFVRRRDLLKKPKCSKNLILSDCWALDYGCVVTRFTTDNKKSPFGIWISFVNEHFWKCCLNGELYRDIK